MNARTSIHNLPHLATCIDHVDYGYIEAAARHIAKKAHTCGVRLDLPTFAVVDGKPATVTTAKARANQGQFEPSTLQTSKVERTAKPAYVLGGRVAVKATTAQTITITSKLVKVGTLFCVSTSSLSDDGGEHYIEVEAAHADTLLAATTQAYRLNNNN